MLLNNCGGKRCNTNDSASPMDAINSHPCQNLKVSLATTKLRATVVRYTHVSEATNRSSECPRDASPSGPSGRLRSRNRSVL
jgi:hypothetical protein